jgi:hypothetical protein
MKKTMTIFGAILFASVIMTSCGGKEEGTAEGAKSEAAAGKWDKLAQVNGLKPEDVQKAIEIGTKMGDCYQLESAPGKMDSEMTEACDPFMKEYKDYCVKTFGTDEYSGDKPENKKVAGFKEIMFDTRNEVAKAKKK